jgi:hypothetical protein
MVVNDLENIIIISCELVMTHSVSLGECQGCPSSHNDSHFTYIVDRKFGIFCCSASLVDYPCPET